MQLAKNPPVKTIEIKTCVTHVLLIKQIQNLTGQSQLKLLKEEGLAHARIDAAVIRQSRKVALVRETVTRSYLTIESGNGLAATIAPRRPQAPRVRQAITSSDVDG